MTRLQKVLENLAKDLEALGIRWAVVGGLAVSARAEPRATRDVDIAVTTSSDEEGESIVAALTARGYLLDAVLEHRMTGRMATVRLRPPARDSRDVLVDLFFASSGVENEIVEQADVLELWPGMKAPTATAGHLLALKILAARPKDMEDISWLLRAAGEPEIERAEQTLVLIKRRGYDREKDLLGTFAAARSGGSEDDYLRAIDPDGKAP